jgi:hypothetical protein
VCRLKDRFAVAEGSLAISSVGVVLWHTSHRPSANACERDTGPALNGLRLPAAVTPPIQRSAAIGSTIDSRTRARCMPFDRLK